MINHKDIKLAFFMHKLQGVQELCEQGNPSANVVRNACADLEAEGVPGVSKLRKWVDENYPETEKGHSRTKVELGDTRSYRAQTKGKDIEEDPFVRVPVELLGIAKGQKAAVTFEEDKIVIRRPEA